MLHCLSGTSPPSFFIQAAWLPQKIWISISWADIQSLASFHLANHELSIEGSCCTLWIHESHETFDPCVLWLGQASLRTLPSKRPHPIKLAQFRPTNLDLGGPRISDDLLNTEEVDWGKPITVTALHTRINQRKKGRTRLWVASSGGNQLGQMFLTFSLISFRGN